ncbi:MAG: general secretion pathway protein GspK [Myxococcota bacterium]
MRRLGPERRRRDRGGVALLVVISTIMFLTVLVTDISFGARVRFLGAVHERDEAKAQALAMTGVNLYRLILMANRQLANNSSFASAMEMFGLSGDALWQMVPFVSTGVLRMLVAGGGEADDADVEEFARTGEVSEEVAEESREDKGSRFHGRNFLDFDGDFTASVQGEDCRVNVNSSEFVSRSQDKRVEETATGQQIYGLLSGEENEQWLRERDLERWDLVGNLADWVDADNFVSSGKGGYEDDFYNTRSSPYLSKNAKFDSLEEIRLVEGWQDDVYERFGDQLTIYGGGKVNVNCAEDDVIRGLLKAYCPTAQESQIDQFFADLAEYRLLSAFKNGSAFYQYVTDQRITCDEGLKSVVDVKTNVFTITSTGLVGDATATYTVVVDYTSSDQGSVLYWRVD